MIERIRAQQVQRHVYLLFILTSSIGLLVTYIFFTDSHSWSQCVNDNRSTILAGRDLCVSRFGRSFIRDVPTSDMTAVPGTGIQIESNELLFQGVILENHLNCEVDAACWLEVMTEDNNIIEVTYNNGHSINQCFFRADAGGYRRGQIVDVYAQSIEQGKASVCPSEKYYIQIKKR